MKTSNFVNDDAGEDSGPIYGPNTDNFLAGLGHKDAPQSKLKILMAADIGATLRSRKMTQTQFAAISGLSQSDISRIVNLAVKDYSVERLMSALMALGKDVLVDWTDTAEAHGELLIGSDQEPESEMALAM